VLCEYVQVGFHFHWLDGYELSYSQEYLGLVVLIARFATLFVVTSSYVNESL